MSQNSKAKRDKRKKQQGKRPFLRLNAQQQVQNHAVLTSEDGQVVAAIGLQGREWLLAIGGQTMGNAENPVPMLAMLKHLANVQEKEGRKVNLEYSELLQKLLDTLAEESGQTADEYLDKLVAEFEGVEAAEGEDDADAKGDAAEAAATDAEAAPAADSDSKPQA
ncbi:hypothetical protein ACK1O1_02185 [Stenotrophomonas maltophilia]|jgi:hypothetical protein|uniref:hypothetical protein n=1 Tax=Stenotrophomonas TaxID=40323 RepID=UPI00201D046D|nr:MULTISPECIES: hypothetical protein [Stenotrophomonas]MBN5024956.1 hypothetical protein [Stenotrophomonas maltophilia]MDH1275425.1 hypothetical protein [Stenotrophomonas sp. GD03937]MDH1485763.1 hypothetical protein [Stenotrophomonas sp. GD03712]MDR2958772.1 hypothetical protein [Stenotrophomonas sp.]UQY94129.1 hypothetical protein LZ605_13330 [Stenotrophomonas maltophilia]